LFWKAQGSINDQQFQQTMLEMRSKGYVEAADYLDRIEDCMWTLHQWSAKGAVTYGQKTSNPSEIINIALFCFQLAQIFFDGIDLEPDAAYRDAEVVHPVGEDVQLVLLVGC
jgi:hypothetical protein